MSHRQLKDTEETRKGHVIFLLGKHTNVHCQGLFANSLYGCGSVAGYELIIEPEVELFRGVWGAFIGHWRGGWMKVGVLVICM